VNVLEQLSQLVIEAVRRDGVLIIPSFAVERAQEILYLLAIMQEKGLAAGVPLFVDSPMAVAVTRIFDQYRELYNPEATAYLQQHAGLFSAGNVHFVSTPDESKALNKRKPPFIIVASSGMATGGRVLHHLERWLPDPRSTVLLVGYQSVGTRGRLLQDGVDTLKMHGERIAVRAHVETVRGLSGHADADQLLAWLRGFEQPPRRAFVVHGEAESSTALALRMRRELGWQVTVPQQGQSFDLS
jgi:metallo-beta-lactamase family protein